MCDKLGVQRCNEWQIDYIISVFDLACDGVVSVKEFQLGYRHLMTILLKNKCLKKKKTAQAMKDPDIIFFQQDGKKTNNALTSEVEGEDSGNVAEDLAYFVREYQRDELKKMEEAKVKQKELDHNDTGLKLDGMNDWSRKTSHGMIPIDTMIVNEKDKEQFLNLNASPNGETDLTMIKEKASNDNSDDDIEESFSDIDMEAVRKEMKEDEINRQEQKRLRQLAEEKSRMNKSKGTRRTSDLASPRNTVGFAIDLPGGRNPSSSQEPALISERKVESKFVYKSNDNISVGNEEKPDFNPRSQGFIIPPNGFNLNSSQFNGQNRVNTNKSHCSDASSPDVKRIFFENNSAAFEFYNNHKKDIELKDIENALDNYTCGNFADLVTSLVDMTKYFIENSVKMLQSLTIVKNYTENFIRNLNNSVLPTLQLTGKSDIENIVDLKDELLKESEESAIMKDIKNEISWKKIKYFIEKKNEQDLELAYKSEQLLKMLNKQKLITMINQPL